jgi:2-haloacid dehalogenase
MTFDISSIKLLVFDVFGTVVDWRSSIIQEFSHFGAKKGISADWAAFADAWRSGYRPSLDCVLRGDMPWKNLDAINRMLLDQVLEQFGIMGLSEAEKMHLNHLWHRLQPWPDALEGLHRLRTRYRIATLSNGNVSLLTNMARYSGLPWDYILSAELVRRYKPDKAVYQQAYQLFGIEPHEAMLVATHKNDLHGAQAVGLKTAFVPRPLEYGPDATLDLTPEPSFDIVARDFCDLAAQLGT